MKTLSGFLSVLMAMSLTACSGLDIKKEKAEAEARVGGIKKVHFTEDGVICYYFAKFRKTKKGKKDAKDGKDAKEPKDINELAAGAGGLSCVRED